MGNSYNSGACNDGTLEIPTGYSCASTCAFVSKPTGVNITDDTTGIPITGNYIINTHVAKYSCSPGYTLSDSTGNDISTNGNTQQCSGGNAIANTDIECKKNDVVVEECGVTPWTDGKIEVHRNAKWEVLDSAVNKVKDTEQIKYECKTGYTLINKNNNSISYATHIDQCTNAPRVLVHPSDVECKQKCTVPALTNATIKNTKNNQPITDSSIEHGEVAKYSCGD